MGFIRKKGESGAATNYITRNQALKKLQISLAAFRRLCILKGIYPREPSNRKKASGKARSTAPTTYYYRKDIQFLLHEPLLDTLREYKIYSRKLKKAVSKREWEVARQLETNAKPEFKLDHIIRERYPSFTDALRDLDDALSMVFLFATLPTNEDGVIGGSRVGECQKLAAEFQAYIAHNRCLKKVFVSVKGIYYQAEIRGQEITWIVPHQFTQHNPANVDFKIMATFLDLYINLIGFVNYKLYCDTNLIYPPKLDSTRDARGAGLESFILESVKKPQLVAANSSVDENGAVMSATEKKKQKKRQKEALAALDSKLASIVAASEKMQQDDEDNEVTSSSVIAATSTLQQQQVGIEVDAAQQTASDKLPTMSDLTQASLKLSKFQNLFKGCVFWVSREVPRNALELLIKSFGGELAWDDEAHLGEEAATTEATQDTRKNKRRGGANSSRSFHCAVSPYKVSDARITHHLVDRPLPQDGSRPSWMSQYSETTREYLQPQWVFDCINAQKLLKTTLYQPGQVLPPHLSPFVKYEEGDYVPEDAKRMFGISAVGVAKEHEEEQQEADNDVEDVEEEEEEEDADADDLSSDEDLHQAELEAEAAGLTYSEFMKQKDEASTLKKKNKASSNNKRKQTLDTNNNSAKKKKMSKAELEIESVKEKKELAKMMMTKKDKRLYEQIQFAKRKREAEAAVLEAKKSKLVKKKLSRAGGWSVGGAN